MPDFYLLGPAPNYLEGTMRLLNDRTCNVIIARDVAWLPTVKIPEQGGGAIDSPVCVEQGGDAIPSGN